MAGFVPAPARPASLGLILPLPGVHGTNSPGCPAELLGLAGRGARPVPSPGTRCQLRPVPGGCARLPPCHPLPNTEFHLSTSSSSSVGRVRPSPEPLAPSAPAPEAVSGGRMRCQNMRDPCWGNSGQPPARRGSEPPDLLTDQLCGLLARVEIFRESLLLGQLRP